MPRSKFRIDQALFCDDFRIERNGKGLIIGLYGNSIVFEKLPVRFNYFVCFVGSVSEAFKAEARIEFIAPDGEVLAVTDVEFGAAKAVSDGPEEVSLLLPLRCPPMDIHSAGKLVVKVRPESGRWKKIAEIDVRTNPDPSSEP